MSAAAWRCRRCGIMYLPSEEDGTRKGERWCLMCGDPLLICAPSYRHNAGPVALFQPLTELEAWAIRAAYAGRGCGSSTARGAGAGVTAPQPPSWPPGEQN